MARRVLTILSLFALTASLTLWFTSHYTAPLYRYYPDPNHAYFLTSRPGRILLAGHYLRAPTGPPPTPLSLFDNSPYHLWLADRNHYVVTNLSDAPPDFTLLGLAAGRRSVLTGGVSPLIATIEFLSIPYALLAALCLLPFLPIALCSLRTRLRRARGLCPTCAYDLCATPDQCPECGTPASPAGRSTTTISA